MNWCELARVTRSGREESRHRGAWALVDAAGRILDSRGDPRQPIWARSSVKAFQALPFVALGLLERHGLGDAHLAVICGSHSGEPRHRALVAEILAAGGLAERDLACGYHRPFDGASAREQIRQGAPDSPLYHNCSGKHAGMLLLARALGASPADYRDPEGPGQRLIRDTLVAFAGGMQPELGWDGCSAPSFRLPLAALARAMAALVADDLPAGLPRPELPWAAAVRRVIAAQLAHPELVGGSRRRLDTDLMRAGGGRILAKSGAEAVELLALPGRALGLALKVADGSDRAVGPVVLALLERWEILRGKDLERVAEWRHAEQIDASGRVTGRVEVLPEGLPTAAAGPPLR